MDDQTVLTQEELNLFNELLSGIKECPNCKTTENVKEFIQGRPSPLLQSLVRKTNKFSLGGCSIRGESKRFSCSKCNTKFN